MRWSLIPALLLSLVPGTAAAEPASCRLCGEEASLTAPAASGTKPMALEVVTSLDFDRVILTGPAGGYARLAPDGSRSTSGALSPMTSRSAIGEVVVRGEPGREVRVELPPRIDLFGFAGGTLAITRLTSNLPPVPRLDAEGRLQFRFGGELFVSGDAEGTYRGDVPITVEYQ